MLISQNLSSAGGVLMCLWDDSASARVLRVAKGVS